MRRIAIIGSGPAGLVAAHALLKAGYRVTLYSDRTAAQWLDESRPTGTAARFDLSLAFERELGLDHWEREAPRGCGVHLTFSQVPGNRLLTLAGRLPRPFLAIDLRMQCHRWMHDFEARGGTLVVEKIDVARLDAVAAEHDLTIVAAGRADLQNLFARDAERSVHAEPQRRLAMMITRGAPMGFDGVPYLPVKFNLFGSAGEAFWVPYLHKDHGHTWNMLFEAKAGGPMDRFQGAKSGAEVVAIAKEVIRDLIPWDYQWARDMELADPNGWLLGGVTPSVRSPVGRLPSGRMVTPLGDTAISQDPIAGQGANTGNKMARHLVSAIVERGDAPFDEAWMRATFESFYADHGAAAFTFSRLLLAPITDAGKELLIAQYGSDGTGDDARQRIANRFIENFNDPRTLTPAFTDLALARSIIATETGRHWWRSAASGRAAIGRNQIRQKLGMAPKHPLAKTAYLEPAPSRSAVRPVATDEGAQQRAAAAGGDD